MLPHSFLSWSWKKLSAGASVTNLYSFLYACLWVLRPQQKTVGTCWHRSHRCTALAEWPQPRSQHPYSSPSLGTAALTCGNWEGKLWATQRYKDQCHSQPYHLGNQLCAKLSSSLHALHSKCCKTKPSDAFYFPRCSSFCTASPRSFTAFLSVLFSRDRLPRCRLMAATKVSELPQLSTKRQHPFSGLCEDPEVGGKKGGNQQQRKPVWSPMEGGGCLSPEQLSTPLGLILPLNDDIPSILAYMVLPVPPTVGSAMLFSFGSLALPNFLVKQFHGTIINYPKSISQHC